MLKRKLPPWCRFLLAANCSKVILGIDSARRKPTVRNSSAMRSLVLMQCILTVHPGERVVKDQQPRLLIGMGQLYP